MNDKCTNEEYLKRERPNVSNRVVVIVVRIEAIQNCKPRKLRNVASSDVYLRLDAVVLFSKLLRLWRVKDAFRSAEGLLHYHDDVSSFSDDSWY